MAMGGGKKTEGVVAANINVTPMIDVMLVLLIIFMIVTPAITAGFQASIPRAMNPDSREEKEGEVRLGIDKDGKFFLDVTDPRTRKRSEEHTSELQSLAYLVCRLLLEKKKKRQ